MSDAAGNANARGTDHWDAGVPVRALAQVLGVLTATTITVFVMGHGEAIPQGLPLDSVPFDLRMPNSTLRLVMDHPGDPWRVERLECDPPI